MKQSSWSKKPDSFAETVGLVESYVRQEIIQEVRNKQLYYHTLDHALAVKRRAKLIFRAIEPVLTLDRFILKSNRLENLLDVCAIAHDMVQEFVQEEAVDCPRKRIPGISETATIDKLVEYIRQLNQELSRLNVDSSILFSDLDLAIIEDTILATICDRDPQAGKSSYSFSAYSIYQPYLYSSVPKISLLGNIIALADLGTLAIDGIEPFVREGILVFLEDNLDLKDLILNCNYPNSSVRAKVKLRLLNMSRFMVSLARERYARLEREIVDFPPPARQILRSQVFVHLNPQTIAKIEAKIPTDDSTSQAELIDFFCLSKNIKM